METVCDSGDNKVKLFLSPHNDDEVLFGAFTILREKPLVVIVTDSVVQEKRGYGIRAIDRRAESNRAMKALMMPPPVFLRFGDETPAWDLIIERLQEFNPVEHVWAPAIEDGGHPHHNKVGEIADMLWPHRVTHYLTYTVRGKSTSGKRVKFYPFWVELKLRALLQYGSQMGHESNMDHFLREQYEYYE
jgi:LmbE family N-acetylglucosaminyl deacetylase